MWRASYLLFRALAGLQHWGERHFTRAGLLVLGGAVLAAVFGVDTSITVSYRIFTLLAALLLLAFAATRFVRARLDVRPRFPRLLTAGEPFSLRFEIANVSDRPVDGLALRVEPADPRPAFAQFRARLRFPTYRGWARLLFANRVALIDEGRVPPLGAHGAAQISLAGRALHRGRLSIATVAVARPEPLGLMRTIAPVAGAADICVLPRRYVLPPLALPGSRRYQPGGLPQGASVGDSEEFLGLRDYRPGDALQRIHWRSYARTGKPVVREYQDEFVARYALALDTFGAPGRESVFEEAVSVAASFAWTLDTQECLLDLLFVGDELHAYTAGHGFLQPQSLLEVLAAVAMRTHGGLATLADAVATRSGQLSGCVFVLIDWDAQRKAMIESLTRSGIELMPLLVAERRPEDAPPVLRVLSPGRIEEGLAAL